MGTLDLPYGSGGKVWRVGVRGEGQKFTSPLTVGAMPERPCCACVHWREKAGRDELRRMGGPEVLREAGVDRSTLSPEKVGRCIRDSEVLCDPLASCEDWKMGSYVSVEAAVVACMDNRG